MRRLLEILTIKWFLLIALFCPILTRAKVYRSCKELQLDMRNVAVDKHYSIQLANGVAVSLLCKGMDTEDPKEYLHLPAGPSNNYALVYNRKGVPNDCRDIRPVQQYNKSGKSEFSKIRFDMGTGGIILDDFTFAKQIGQNNIKYGTAGDFFASNKKCQPRGNFKVDLTGTPFVISKTIKWFWKGKFSDGTTDGVADLKSDSYVGCYADKKDRAMPAALRSSSRMNVGTCKTHCRYKGFYYAGLENGIECWCGNSFAKHGTAKNCNKKCGGNRKEICGGIWALSVYVIGEPQFKTGRCGGYPGSCFPAQKYDNDSHLLLLDITPKHPCLKNICGPFSICLAIDSMGYSCLCSKGFTGKNCEKRMEIVQSHGVCPPKYQPESCQCDASNCYGAKFINNICVTNGGKSKVLCRYGDPSHVHIFRVNSRYSTVASCPMNSNVISCSYWDPHRKIKGNGVRGPTIRYRSCSYYRCRGCMVQVTCMKYNCGCKNGGICDLESQQCHCRPGYTGELCENYDYCSFWETSHQQPACGRSGICTSVPKLVVSTTGGDKAGDTCIFPFKYQGQTFSRCISDNRVGPPFACGTEFNGRSSYISVGRWSPGPSYTILVWVKPTVQDSKNRLIVGSISDCRDFGIGYQFGRFQTYYASRKGQCTITVSTHDAHHDINKWHAVAVMNTGRRVTLMVNGKIWSSSFSYSNFLANVNGFYIGGGPYNYGSNFKGTIKNVKIYNKALRSRDVDDIFAKDGVEDSVDEIKRGLVGHYELGEKLPEKCNGIDHFFQDWIPETLSQISGVHCNISRFIIEQGTKVFITRWNGVTNGSLEVTANMIQIDGELTAAGAGYRGGKPSNDNGGNGNQGESHSDSGNTDHNRNRGGGGGGFGETQSARGGLPGGGGGHGSIGRNGTKKGVTIGNGVGGMVYGVKELHYAYLGSGGGSGGNALDLTKSPRGGAGGNGGGVIKLYADTRLTVTGSIDVQGEDGEGDPFGSCFACPAKCNSHMEVCTSTSRTSCWDKSGPGGGGSGGSIYLSGETVDIGVNRLFATGGNGGRGAYMCGGAGGVGRIYLQSTNHIGQLDKTFGQIVYSSRKDKIKDYSHLGHTVGNDDILINKNPVYLGCFKESQDFLLKHKLKMTPSQARRLTPTFCHTLCSQAGHIYSGTTNGDQCYCDDHVTTTFYGKDTDCNSPCPGDRRQFCGGTSMVLVFGPKPESYARRAMGAPIKCASWCVTADVDAKQPKWGQCVDEQSTLAMNISCECPKGTTGENCDQDCPPGTWGTACRNKCNCNGHPCDATNGNCNCKTGFGGQTCDRKQCPPRTMGRNCDMCKIYNHYGKDCKKCDCGRGRCNTVTGKCRCATGRTGDKCEKVCPTNKWGVDCYHKCSCYNNATCEPMYGMCHCSPGYAGRRCQEHCPEGSYGDRCGSSCPICTTDTCHHVTGNCLCDAGYKGANCTEICPSGSWDVGCAKKCDQDCQNGCNPMEGFCCPILCSDGQYCSANATCIGEVDTEVIVTEAVTASLGTGPIVGIILVVLLAILSAIVIGMYFLQGKKMFTFAVAKYQTQKDDVVIDSNFANPFYERMNDASKPEGTSSETEAAAATNGVTGTG